MSILPKVCDKGKAFYITSEFPPIPGGSSVINRNLLSMFDPSSFKVLTRKVKASGKIENFQDIDIEAILSSFSFSSRLNYFFSEFQVSSAVKKAVQFVEKEKPSLIIGTFPDYYFLKIARDTAKKTGLPLVVYLHDTISESRSGSRNSKQADILQEQVFKEASAVFVMSKGMEDLYKAKYGLDSISLEHTYLENIPSEVPGGDLLKQAFWGGYVYSINNNSVLRVSNALKDLNYDFFFATNVGIEGLKQSGLEGFHIKQGFFSKRNEYLSFLKQNGMLILALDWPDESNIHRDELATIFPTKTPEYLAAGNPILVHCPEDYFLAKFFRDNNCGYVVSDRSPETLNSTLQKLIHDPGIFNEMRINALKTAEIFKADIIAKRFKGIVDRAAGSK